MYRRSRRRPQRPPAWTLVIGALAVLVIIAWVVRESPTMATDRGGQTTAGATVATDATTAATTAPTRTGPEVTPERREMAQIAMLKLKITNGAGRQKLVALTFDDGPGPLTMPLLDILKRLGVKATFYVQGGNIANHPDALRRMVEDGHEIGIHTWNHPQLTTLWGDELTSQVYDTRDEIRKVAGVDPGTMRPPYGDIDDRVMNALAPARLVQVLWDVDTNDWGGYSTSAIVDHVLTTATAGSIVLMHDGGGTQRQATVDAVEPIVNALLQKGVEFVTVQELLMRDPPREARAAMGDDGTSTAPDGTGTAPADGTATAPVQPVSDPASSPYGDPSEPYAAE